MAWRKPFSMLNSKRTGKQNGIEVRTHMTYFTLKDTESSRHVGLQRDGITFFYILFYFIIIIIIFFYFVLFLTSISCRDCTWNACNTDSGRLIFLKETARSPGRLTVTTGKLYHSLPH